MVTVAIAIGLAIGFAFEALTGIAAGGLVVPGYVALYLLDWTRVAMTAAVALVTFGAVRLLESRIILYGRTRRMFAMLIAFALNWGLAVIWPRLGAGQPDAMAAIGHLVPGILAMNMLRAGPDVTLMATGIAAIVTRLLLMVVVGEAALN